MRGIDGISLYDAVIAGLVALKGPRTAAWASPRARRTLVAGDAAAVIRERVALGERFPGFGHVVYGDAIRARMHCSRRW